MQPGDLLALLLLHNLRQRDADEVFVSMGVIAVTERRRLPRNRTFLGASISFNNRYSTFDCTVVNLTTEGAMLTTSGTSNIPEVFDLFVTHKSQSFIAKSVWREQEHMGVKFIDARLATPPVPLDFARRLKACETEKEALKQRIAQLSEPA